MKIDLNCDMGEGLPNDALLMPYISSANIACGYHAGDKDTMKRTVELALQQKVAIGAHPGFNDKENFGRTEMQLDHEALFDLITQQVYDLQEVASSFDAAVHHVKPHGALYNMAAKDAGMSQVIARAVKAIDPSLVLLGLSGSHSVDEAKKTGLTTASEVFADRTYQDDGSLTPRSRPDAMILTTGQCMAQVLQMVLEQSVTSIHDKKIPIVAQTICIHGDGEHAVAFAKKIHHVLQQHKVDIQKI